MFKASPISRKNAPKVVFIFIMFVAIFFAISKLFPSVRETTKQDYLYYQSSYGFLGLGSNTKYEIGSFSNQYKQKNNFGNVVGFMEYNKLDDSIYLGTLGECTIKIISREGHKTDLNFCVLKDRGLTYGVNYIAFDKKNYKYLILDGGSYKKPVNAIVIFNEKQEVIKDIRSKFRIESLVVLDHAVVFTQLDDYGDDLSSQYLNIYDLKTNKMTVIDLSKKHPNLDSITTLLQLDNDYLISYEGKDDFNYVITSKGKLINKSTKAISAYNPSYPINSKWYLDVTVSKGSEDGDGALVEYTKDSFRIIEHEKICDRYNPLIFNNKSVYCVAKKDNNKIISVLDNDKNVYKLDKKYEYDAYHRLALFGFK